MKATRGRIGQNKVLQMEQQLHSHLVSYERFSKESLFSMLAHHPKIRLKPIYGPEVITISVQQGVYHLNINDSSIVVSEKQDVYKIVLLEMKEQQYIIQPQWVQTSLMKMMFYRFITVHKKDSKWHINFTTKHCNYFFERLVYRRCSYKLEKLAMLAAQQLGRFYEKCESIVVEMAFNLKGEVFIYDTTLHFPISKWSQYQYLYRFMPHTDLLTETSFQEFLKQYPTIFLKPCNGQHGKNIIKINKLNDTRYEIYTGISKLEKQEALETYKMIRQMCVPSKDYIIQQGIPLAIIDDCFIDVRVMTQKIEGVWQVTGKAVKVAGRLFFVTNAARTILTLEEALQQTPIPFMRQQKLEADINALCLAAVKELRHHASLTIVGFDVGITAQGEVWIIEGNYVPDISLFKQLEDKIMYETIVKNRLLVKRPSE